MFQNCNSLEYLNMQIFKVNNLTSFISVFQNCHSLKEINISNFDLSNIKSIRNLFDVVLI